MWSAWRLRTNTRRSWRSKRELGTLDLTDRVICGWRVRSTLSLPETAPWRGADCPPDIEIRRGAVPARLGERTAELSYIETAPDGRLLVDATPIGRFLVTPDCVVVDTPLEASATEWRACLLGPVLAVLCYLRGALPLHASALRIGDRAIAIAGKSGAGKSTLAAALSCRGHPLITDDICACTGLPRRPLVLPTYPAIKIDRVGLDVLDIDSRSLLAIGPDFAKVQLLRLQRFDPTPLPLDIVYLIEDAPEGVDDAVIPANGAEGFRRLSAEIYRPPIGRLLLAKPAFFAMATQLARQVTIRRLVRRSALAGVKALAETIERDATQHKPHFD